MILHRDLDKEVPYTELPQRVCTEFVQRTLREILYRDFAKGSFTNILPKELLYPYPRKNEI